MRQLLIESLVLAVFGGASGWSSARSRSRAEGAPATDLLFTPWARSRSTGACCRWRAALTVLTARAFGLVPALQATRSTCRPRWPKAARDRWPAARGGWPRRLLVVAEVALGVVLLVGAGLLIRTFVHLQIAVARLRPPTSSSASASLDDARYAEARERRAAVRAQPGAMRAMPGVESAAVSLGLPYERILNMGVRMVGGRRQAAGTP